MKPAFGAGNGSYCSRPPPPRHLHPTTLLLITAAKSWNKTSASSCLGLAWDVSLATECSDRVPISEQFSSVVLVVFEYRNKVRVERQEIILELKAFYFRLTSLSNFGFVLVLSSLVYR